MTTDRDDMLAYVELSRKIGHRARVDYRRLAELTALFIVSWAIVGLAVVGAITIVKGV